MAEIPTYTADENLNRIQMEKSIKFVVVEGKSDVPIYEIAIRSMLDLQSDTSDIIYVGGKKNIKKLIQEIQTNNYICIADKDFDPPINSRSVISLGRYSIENYFICEEAISGALAVAMNESYKKIKQAFNLSHFLSEVSTNASTLLKVAYFYHRVIVPNKSMDSTANISWSNRLINRHTGSWGVCQRTVNELINELKEDANMAEIERFFAENYNSPSEVAYDLPGKMLKALLQQYIANFYRQYKNKGGGQLKNIDTCMQAIISHLNLSTEFKRQISPVFEFLSPLTSPPRTET